MVNVFQKKVLMLAVYAGEIMMKSGAEIYRVEDTVTRICKAGGIRNVEVFATPTGLFTSMDKGGEDDDTQTYIKRIKSSDTNLEKISDVNHFSRQFSATDLSVEDGMEMLTEIDDKKHYPFIVRFIGAIVIASCFAILFGGTAMDFFVAMLSGGAAYTFSVLLHKLDINAFVIGFCACGLATFLAVVLTSSLPGASYGPVIIGSIMIFVPGVAITNSIRDFLSGDMLSGVARMMEAILTAVSLATGAGVVLKLFEVFGGFNI